MNQYKLTAFEPSGEKILDEAFESPNDEEAKVTGENILKEKGLEEKTHRCTTSAGKLILFHR